MTLARGTLLSLLFVTMTSALLAAEPPDFAKEVAPILKKYCAGCHNPTEKEGGLSLLTYEEMLRGGKKGSVVSAGMPEMSRMIRMITGQAKPVMPPEGEAAPKKEEVEILIAWIKGGARGPQGTAVDPTILVTPKIAPKHQRPAPVTSLAISPDGAVLAIGREDGVELVRLPNREPIRKLSGQRGLVNSVEFSRSGELLAVASGEPGLSGEAKIWKWREGQAMVTVGGLGDSYFDAAFSPDGSILATGGYDRQIRLWDVATQKLLQTLSGHNAAVYDLAFHPQGKILASASADRTVKLWRVSSGNRLDTLSQSLAELRSLAFDPQGKRLIAAGSDNRIRLWQISESAEEGTNPLLESRYAHEAPILRLIWSGDGSTVLSAAEDRRVKAWHAERLTSRAILPQQPDWPVALAFAEKTSDILIGRPDGQIDKVALPAAQAESAVAVPLPEFPEVKDYGPQPPLDKLPRMAESEPNDQPAQAKKLEIPGVATGAIHGSAATDIDLFRFSAKKGEEWVLETNAARKGAPLDTKLEVLDESGKAVPKLLLRAVRDTELEFRSCTSDARGMRLKNYEEMYLNQFVYLQGEVVKHFRQRRGPDSDADLYPESGSRYAYFGTSSQAHFLGVPGYVVVPYPLGSKLPDNGLPVITLNYENDDDGFRQLGKDSRIAFTAPADGEYLVRVSDVRGFSGEKFAYDLTIRRPTPSFKVTLGGMNPAIEPGTGKQFTVKAERFDGFMGEIRVEIEGLPPGYRATSPVVIEPGHWEARGMIHCAADAPKPSDENKAKSQATAKAIIAGKEISVPAGSLGEIKRPDAAAKVIVYLEPSDSKAKQEAGGMSDSPAMPADDARLQEVVIKPGTTVTCQLRVTRNGFGDRIQFDVENLPHGIIVDNIGLNGVLMPENQTERTIFLSAEPWVGEQVRLFHAVAKVAGDPVSLPMRIRVKK